VLYDDFWMTGNTEVINPLVFRYVWGSQFGTPIRKVNGSYDQE